MGSPSLNFAPFKSNSILSAPLMVRQDFSASSMSLKAKPKKVFLLTQLRALVVRCLTVAKVDSIGLVVRICCQCSAGKW